MLISPFFVKVNIAVAVKGMLVNIAYWTMVDVNTYTGFHYKCI
jgi:hypothetical protein